MMKVQPPLRLIKKAPRVIESSGFYFQSESLLVSLDPTVVIIGDVGCSGLSFFHAKVGVSI